MFSVFQNCLMCMSNTCDRYNYSENKIGCLSDNIHHLTGKLQRSIRALLNWTGLSQTVQATPNKFQFIILPNRAPSYVTSAITSNAVLDPLDLCKLHCIRVDKTVDVNFTCSGHLQQGRRVDK